jgi:hypothetical protein
MQSSMDRGRRISRHAILWLIGPLVLIARHSIGELAPAHRCAPAIDLLGVAILRQWPDLEIGQLLAWFQPAVVVFVLACVAELFDRLTRNIVVVLGTGLMMAFSPLFIPALALLTPVAAVGLCAAAALVIGRITPNGRRSLIDVGFAGAVLLLAALVVPSWTVACALGACAITWSCSAQTGRRSVRVAGALATAAIVGVVPFAMLRATHMPALGDAAPWYACATPIAANVPALLPQVFRTIGPVISALAVLGLAVGLLRDKHVWWVVVASPFVALACWPVAGLAPSITLAPLFLATWSAAAIGLDEILRQMQRARGGIVAAAVLLCVLPVLEAARVRDQERDVVRPVSQERASLAAMTSILNLVPAGARFVEEDASIDLLLRAALLGGRRSSKPFMVIPVDRRRVEHALAESTTVWAFPLGQQLLTLRGFEMRPDGELPMRGVARVAAVRSCQELGMLWVDLSAEGRHGRIAIVAASETDVGPVDLYFGGPTEYAPGPDGWPPRLRSRFRLSLFDRSASGDAARLEAEARDLHLAAQPVFQAAFVSRMFIERTPRSPLELPIVLGPPRPVGLGRLHQDASPHERIVVCDAPPVTLSTF